VRPGLIRIDRGGRQRQPRGMSTTTEDTASATANDQRTDDRTGYRTGRGLTRSTDDRMLAGVAGGLARYLNVDVTLVRVAIAALTLVTSGSAVALYAAAWLLIPADDQDESIVAAWLAARRDDSR
jgi:phage shock protein PspC (stress-responsive transcriptional regulator)